MNTPTVRRPDYLAASGCLGMLLVFGFLCLMPFVLVDAMTTALVRLHLDASVAVLAVVGIFLGSLVNIPLYRIEREEEQIVEMVALYGLTGWSPRWRRVRRDTLVAINVGGCLIPAALAVWQLPYIIQMGETPLLTLAVATAANILICYRAARPVEGVGIMMPGFLSPLVAVGTTWLLMSSPDYDLARAPVAFVAGVAGPLVGADLLHLREITKVSVGVLSFGGAGTFDGIVLSGVLAALFA